MIPSQRHLCRHDSLPLDHQLAVGALTLSPTAQSLVALEARNHPVVAAPRALGRSKKPPPGASPSAPTSHQPLRWRVHPLQEKSTK